MALFPLGQLLPELNDYEEDWLDLLDMTEKSESNDNSELILSLAESEGHFDDVYVVHYDMTDVGECSGP